ncbi:MAG TPA: beta-N-acetylglucosaminidase, partial [Cryomorphaceae bacterium]|nr:beta-N-acetylglucosaminidase [Cryomorphaceae bacterium]
MKLTLRSFFLFALFISGPGMGIYAQVIRPSVIWEGDTSWAREKLKNMSMDEKLGQLFMIAAYSNKGKAHQDEIINLVKNEHIGGLIFFQGGPQKQARLTNIYQQGAKIPLMIAMDAEWGLSMRLDSTFKFPWPLTVGATRDSALA